MTDRKHADAERAWEAYEASFGNDQNGRDDRRHAFFSGWESKSRPRATPLVIEQITGTTSVAFNFYKWIEDNAIPVGTRIRVTMEESPIYAGTDAAAILARGDLKTRVVKLEQALRSVRECRSMFLRYGPPWDQEFTKVLKTIDELLDGKDEK